MQGWASAVKPSGKTTGSPLAAGDPLASGDPLSPALGRRGRLGGRDRRSPTATAWHPPRRLPPPDEDAGQDGAAEQRQDPEREEAEDGDGTEARPVARRAPAILVGIAVVVWSYAASSKLSTCSGSGASVTGTSDGGAPQSGGGGSGGGRRAGRARPLVAIAGHVAGRHSGGRRRSALVEVVRRVASPASGRRACVSSGPARSARTRRTCHPRSPAAVRIAAGASGADAVLQLVAVHAARADAGVRRDRRAALGAEGGGRRGAVAGRAADLARLGGRHVPRIVPVDGGACTRRGSATLRRPCAASTWSARAAPARRRWPAPGRRLGHPYVEIDALFWGSGWTGADGHLPRPPEEALAADAWIADGGYERLATSPGASRHGRLARLSLAVCSVAGHAERSPDPDPRGVLARHGQPRVAQQRPAAGWSAVVDPPHAPRTSPADDRAAGQPARPRGRSTALTTRSGGVARRFRRRAASIRCRRRSARASRSAAAP